MQLLNTDYPAGPFPPAIQNRWAHRVALGGVAIVLVLVLLHIVNGVTLDLQLLDLNSEQNLPSWVSSFGFALAGLTAAAVGLSDRALRPWLAIGVLMLAFSLDDIAMLHERFEELGDTGLALLVIEPLMVLGFLIVFAAAARTVRGVPRVLFLAAILALAIAQVASSAGFVREHVPVPLGTLIVLEEGAELLVSALLLGAAVQPLLARVNAVLLRERRRVSRPRGGPA